MILTRENDIMPWEITPLELGVLSVPKKNMLSSASKTERIGVPVLAWLLSDPNSGKHILVDSGASEQLGWAERYHNPLQRKRKNQYLRIALEEHGVEPASVYMILLTHLHWDHAYGVRNCPNARVFVQKYELCYAIDPTHKDAKIYETSNRETIPFFLEYYTRMEVIDGDVEILNGICAVTLPGHSPGSQGVLVNTIKGKYLIAGDCVNVIENMQQLIPGGIYENYEMCQRSIQKAISIADVVLPSHDWRVFQILG